MAFFGNLMNNYFYGKAGKGDYTMRDMPENRFQLFGAVFKVHWSGIAGVNLLYIIPWIPTILWTLLSLSAMMAGEAAAAQGVFFTYLLVLIPCIAITGPFTAGVTYVMRNWARDEHSFVWSDYWDAVKGNWKQALPVSIISGIVPFLMYIAMTFYGQMAANSVIFYLPIALVFMMGVVWKLMEMVLYVMMVTYNLTLRQLLRNGLLMTLARLPHAIGIKLLTWVIPAIFLGLCLVLPQYQIMILMIYILAVLIYVPGFNHLIRASYANAICEKYLNTQIEGAQTNIGLRPEDWDDTEYIPEDDE